MSSAVYLLLSQAASPSAWLFSGAVYLLCAATSLTSAWLLWRAARKGGVRLLYWSSLCFLGMAINNLLLYADLIVGPSWDLSMAPNIANLVSLILLCYGLIWDAT